MKSLAPESQDHRVHSQKTRWREKYRQTLNMNAGEHDMIPSLFIKFNVNSATRNKLPQPPVDCNPNKKN